MGGGAGERRAGGERGAEGGAGARESARRGRLGASERGGGRPGRRREVWGPEREVCAGGAKARRGGGT